MKNLHKLIILVILSVLSVSNVFGTNEYENCENNLGIEKYGNLNKTLYDKVTSLGSKLVAKYSTLSETVRSEKINKVFSLITNLKTNSKLTLAQTQIVDLLGYHISCEMKKVGIGTVLNNTQTNTIQNTKFFTVDKTEIEKGETITFSNPDTRAELSSRGLSSICILRDSTGNSFSNNSNTSGISMGTNITATPKFTTTYVLQCTAYGKGPSDYYGTNVESITVKVNDKNLIGMANKKADETWDYGFYVIYENNDYDNDQKMEGCNEAGLSYPETLCILKLGDMYVSPKNFTMKNNFTPKYDSVDDGTHIYSTKSYNKTSAGLVNKQTFINQEVYMNGLIGYSLKNISGWASLCSSNGEPYCSNYKAELEKVPNNIFDYDALSCNELFNFKRGNAEIKALGNKKWEDLNELGGDGLNNNCSKDGSDTQGLCALQLNKSKLKLYTSGIYYGYNGGSGNMLGISNNYYGGYIAQSSALNTARFLTFGSLERYKPEVLTNSNDNTANKGPISYYKLLVEGNELDLNNLELYTRCVGY